MGFQGGAVAADNFSHCGALCGTTPGCTVARFRGKLCAFVGFGHPVSGWGMASMDTVWPPATPLPVRAPPAECIVETHGPYVALGSTRAVLGQYLGSTRAVLGRY